MNSEEIEYAGFCSWPADEQQDLDRVVLRFSNGYTKRANSATVLQQQTGDFSNLVQQCEDYYQKNGIPCTFRLPSFSQNEALDQYLEHKAYTLLDRSLVLYKPIKKQSQNTVNLQLKTPEQWIESFCKLKSIDIKNQQHHLKILNRIKDDMLLAVSVEHGQDVACGIAVVSNGYCGIFDIFTHKNFRKQGHATKLLNGLLNWAISRGATQSYIQVIANNQAAIKLYEKLGYITCYKYHYRIKLK